MSIHDQLRALGLDFSANGRFVTVTSECVGPLFGGPFEWCFGGPCTTPFSLTMTSRDLQRIRGTIHRSGQAHLEVAVEGWVGPTYPEGDDSRRRTTRLLLKKAGNDEVSFTVTTWFEGEKPPMRWLVHNELGMFTRVAVEHLRQVDEIWTAGVRPLGLASKLIAAGLTSAEAIDWAAASSPSLLAEQVEALIALRSPA